MKQHIVIDQWNEISQADQNRLENLFSLDDTEYSGNGRCTECGKSGLPTIGQLIEYLVEQGDGAFKIDFDESCGHAIYRLEFGHNGSDGHSEGLCDALWKACKEVLEHNNTGSKIDRQGHLIGIV